MRILSALKRNDQSGMVDTGRLDTNDAVRGVRPPTERGGKRKKDKITDKHT